MYQVSCISSASYLMLRNGLQPIFNLTSYLARLDTRTIQIILQFSFSLDRRMLVIHCHVNWKHEFGDINFKKTMF